MAVVILYYAFGLKIILLGPLCYIFSTTKHTSPSEYKKEKKKIHTYMYVFDNTNYRSLEECARIGKLNTALQ